MVALPGGRFQMGSPAGESGHHDDERQHEVRVEAFVIGRTEVTFDEYDAFAAATGRQRPDDEGWGRGRHPVINVSWHDATAYAEWRRGGFANAATDARSRSTEAPRSCREHG
jgi:formylglycine-generating enzyme required for sulfatase activity